MTTATAQAADTGYRPEHDHPVVVGVTEIAKLLPVALQTVYSWNSESRGRRRVLPEPLFTVSKTPVWALDDILDLARKRGLEVDQEALEAVQLSQPYGTVPG